jgi:hypothetical protein
MQSACTIHRRLSGPGLRRERQTAHVPGSYRHRGPSTRASPDARSAAQTEGALRAKMEPINQQRRMFDQVHGRFQARRRSASSRSSSSISINLLASSRRPQMAAPVRSLGLFQPPRKPIGRAGTVGRNRTGPTESGAYCQCENQQFRDPKNRGPRGRAIANFEGYLYLGHKGC